MTFRRPSSNTPRAYFSVEEANSILEPEGVQELAQLLVHVMREGLFLSEGIRDGRERLAEMLLQHLRVGQVFGTSRSLSISSEKAMILTSFSSILPKAWSSNT